MKGRQSNILPMKAELPDTHTHKSLIAAARWEGTFLNCDLAFLASEILLTPNEQWFPFEGHSFLWEEMCS